MSPGFAAGRSARIVSASARWCARISAAVALGPGAGTVTHLNVVRGQSVTAGQPVATVADLTSLWLVAKVDETSFKDVRPGQPVEVYLNALDRYFGGEVVGLVPDLPLTPQNVWKAIQQAK